MNFRNKNIIISGSSAGIGKASAELFLRNGGNVVINGSSETGREVAEEFDRKYE